jgi:RNA polymerase sigma-70 factor (ECF subfamily)
VESDSSDTFPSWGALLVRSREGDDTAFEDLVRGCERRVLAIAYQITGNLEDAQDVAQESFLRIYRSRHRFEDGRSFEAWLYRIVVNQAKRSYARRARRRMSSLEDAGGDQIADTGGESASQAADAAHLSKIMKALLEELSPRLRSVFVLRDLQGMETGQIAQILDCTETTVRRHSALARIRVRRLIQERHPELGKPRQGA